MIFVGIDGTGPEWIQPDPQYFIDFADSHVKHLRDYVSEWKADDHRHYNRGPTTSGVECKSIAEDTYGKALKMHTTHQAPIFLAGYSRGGAIAVEVAAYLKQRNNIPVECLILFDPVDRAHALGGWFFTTPIVDTVKNVIIALRDPVARSRESFGNCGLRRQNEQKTVQHRKVFYGTHGGLGGVPHKPKEGVNREGFISEGPPDGATFVTYVQDEAAKHQVRSWMLHKLLDIIAAAKDRQASNQIGTIDHGALTPVSRQELRTYIVQPGDSLSKIAMKVYGDMNKWKDIYNHSENRKKIGANPNLIHPNWKLIIP